MTGGPDVSRAGRRGPGGGRALGWAAALATTLSACSPAAPLNLLASARALEVTQSVPYAEGARRTLDVYRPRDAKDAPVVVFFYGGSWQSGSKDTYRFVASALANRGYVTIVPDYRVYPEVRYPGFLEDCAQAVAWARANAARFGGDRNRIVLMGHSAGAYIAAMLAIDPRWLQKVHIDSHRDIAALVGIAGPYDFLPLHDPKLVTIFGGANVAATQPISYVRGGEPPAFLATGGGDTIVDPGNTKRLAARLRAVGDSVTDKTYPGVGHLPIIGAFSPALRFIAPVLQDSDAFLRGLPQRRPAPQATVGRAGP